MLYDWKPEDFDEEIRYVKNLQSDQILHDDADSQFTEFNDTTDDPMIGVPGFFHDPIFKDLDLDAQKSHREIIKKA